MLTSHGFSVTALLDREATPAAVALELQRLVTGATCGDTIFFTYSGHGTTVPDNSGDESDYKDEAMYLFGGVLLDDDLRRILDQTPTGVRITAIMDCCHSGSNTRAIPGEDAPRIRHLPYRGIETETQDLPLGKPLLGRDEESMVEVLITGCRDTEYSYDASFNGQSFGAMTYYATEILRNNPNLTYDKFFELLRTKLPNNQYPQTPQLEGRYENRFRPFFS